MLDERVCLWDLVYIFWNFKFDLNEKELIKVSFQFYILRIFYVYIIIYFHWWTNFQICNNFAKLFLNKRFSKYSWLITHWFRCHLNGGDAMVPLPWKLCLTTSIWHLKKEKIFMQLYKIFYIFMLGFIYLFIVS